jgi:hypothetical protein
VTNKISTGDPAHAWFVAGTSPTSPNADTRGLSYDPDSNRVLAADRDSVTGNVVQTIDANTFAYAGPVAGGNIVSPSLLFPLNKVRVATDGAIYVTGMGTTAGHTMHVHRHADVLSTSTIATTFSINARLGDDMVTTGGGNNLIMLMAGSGNTAIWRLTSTDGGITLNAQQLSVVGDTLSGFNYISFDPDDNTTIWTRQGQASNTTTAPLKRFTLGVSDATFVTSSSLAVLGGSGPHLMVRYNGDKLNITGEIGTSNGQVGQFGKKVVLMDPVTGVVSYQGIGIERGGSGTYANANGAGDIVWAPQIDRLFVLMTSNAITAFNTGPIPAAARDWNLY